MRKLILLAAVAALFLVALPIASAGADSPFEEVTIDVATNFPEFGPPNGAFTASGPAVAAGLICASGWSFDPAPAKFAPREGSSQGINVQAVKVFLCDAELGEYVAPNGFVIRQQVRFDYKKGGDTFNWVVTDGWGDYSAMAGNGHGSGDFVSNDRIQDVFSGKVR
jgi:hypothetical protein